MEEAIEIQMTVILETFKVQFVAKSGHFYQV